MLCVMTDASWNRQPRSGSQQGYVMALGDKQRGTETEAAMSIVAWSSTRIRRVVRSTLAAEAAALATGYDMVVYVRVLDSRLLGTKATEWDEQARDIKQETWIDCKSLNDMLHKTGGAASEQRVALDVHDVQQYIGDDCDTEADVLRWISTVWMLADPLTKPMAATTWTALNEFIKTGRWKLSAPTGTAEKK